MCVSIDLLVVMVQGLIWIRATCSFFLYGCRSRWKAHSCGYHYGQGKWKQERKEDQAVIDVMVSISLSSPTSRPQIREKEEAAAGLDDLEEGSKASGVTPKVREVYTEIGKMLKTYTAGKLPKAFKILPALANWEEVVYLTRPDEWTPHVSSHRHHYYTSSSGWPTERLSARSESHYHLSCDIYAHLKATYAATRIFASNLNAKLSQRFFNLILLEKCRDDIIENKNLNYHYYMGKSPIPRLILLWRTRLGWWWWWVWFDIHTQLWRRPYISQERFSRALFYLSSR